MPLIRNERRIQTGGRPKCQTKTSEIHAGQNSFNYVESECCGNGTSVEGAELRGGQSRHDALKENQTVEV
jgi:hypothetical protein